MARFVFTAWSISGSIFPALSVASAVAARGHEVAIYTGARSASLVQGAGLRYFPFSRSLDEMVDSVLVSPHGISRAWPYPWRRLPMMRRFVLDTVPQQVADLDHVLDEWSPDVIVCEPAMWAPYLILHEARQIPVAALEYSFCTLPGKSVPPLGLASLGLSFTRSRHWYERLLYQAGARAYAGVMAPFRRAASRLRRAYGLPSLDGTMPELLGRLPLVLVPSCPEYDYQRQDLPPSINYVGACLWYPPQEPPAWLAAVPRTAPWVHATEGTLYAQRPRVLQSVAQGLAGLDVQVIMTTGNQQRSDQIDLGVPGANMVVKPWVSYPDLLPLTNAMVTIGGGGTVMGALAHGVPLVVVPTAWDHPENAQRVVDAGVGVTVPLRRCTPRTMRHALEQVLYDPSYRHNAQRLAERLRQLGGPARAAVLLEQLAHDGRSR